MPSGDPTAGALLDSAGVLLPVPRRCSCPVSLSTLLPGSAGLLLPGPVETLVSSPSCPARPRGRPAARRVLGTLLSGADRRRDAAARSSDRCRFSPGIRSARSAAVAGRPRQLPHGES